MRRDPQRLPLQNHRRRGHDHGTVDRCDCGHGSAAHGCGRGLTRGHGKVGRYDYGHDFALLLVAPQRDHVRGKVGHCGYDRERLVNYDISYL